MAGRLVKTVELIVVTWWLHLRMLSVSAFQGFMQVVWPLIFATAALLVVRTGGNQDVVIFTALGVATMGIWSAIATTASSILQEQRSEGTLELLVAAPTPFSLVLIPISMAMATLGLVSVGASLLWMWLVFDIAIPVANVPMFCVSLIVTIAAMSTLGFLLSVSVARYRTAWAFGNMLEFPGWLLCGFVVPLGVLPDWVRPVSAVLAPTWGVDALRAAAAGDSAWRSLGLCAGLGLAYLAVGALGSAAVLRSARRRATLSLS